MQSFLRLSASQALAALVRWAGMLVLSVSLTLAGSGTAQQLDTIVSPLIEVVTEGKGPGETVTGFRLAKDAAGKGLPDAAVLGLGQALADRDRARQESASVDMAMQTLGLSVGAVNAIGTMAESALWIDALGPTNQALNNLGLIVALAQMARDVSKGDDRAAATGGLKAYLSYAISRWGWGALQIGGVALFVTDVTLTQWQSGLTAIATDVWSCRYKAWYKANGRKVRDWKIKAWELYLAAEGKDGQSYDTYIDGVLNDYVGLAFRDGLLATYGDCSGSSFGDQEAIRQAIMAEHKAVLQKLLATRVMPEVAEWAWVRQLKGQVAEAETILKPRLNRKFRLEVTAYGVTGPARVVMPLPAGGEWAGRLREDGTFRAELTLYAVLKAGFPDTVRLETEGGVEERKLVMSGDRVTAMFGAPETPLVSRYRLTEGAQSCMVTRIAADGSTTETTSDAARPAQEVDFAMLAGGTWVFGRYAPGAGWSPASPGITSGTAITLGAPLHDDIAGFDNCSIGFLTDDALAKGDCTVKRHARKAVSAKVTIERKCSASAGLEIIGVFTAMGGEGMQYMPLDGPEGEMMGEILKRSMAEGVKSFDLETLPGMPPMTGLPQLP
ncbi:hypothetical protein LHP98_13285 [Rhodobacter sp. Har01]|uniref:hypothetical protein n=1 Tax=Rhodobacter sp. Har01 TaxID=2883999 RepID=UPI001D060722|nr:hypothetical protein [Rhodobacter sp. Har01]MCB6179092.1 hypothetical protein [Rhodobacter sp. Har01]